MTRRSPRAEQLGVTDAEYARMLDAQHGHCALCPNTPKTRRLHVDHDHRTGAVRGLLCFSCNRTLPHYKDSAWLARASDYVASHEARAGDATDAVAAPSPSVDHRADDMRAARRNGETLQAIATRYGVSRQRVHQILSGK
jgi:hypothetical protein